METNKVNDTLPMKTAKEIEKLAFDTILSEQGQLGFVVGYNCCQKDISQEFYDKKSEEENSITIKNVKFVEIPETITDEHGRKLEIFCISDENGKTIQYYKFSGNY